MKFNKIIILTITLLLLCSFASAEEQKFKDKQKIIDVKTGQKDLKESKKDFKQSDFKYKDKNSKVFAKTDIKLKTEKHKHGLEITATNAGKGKADKHDILVAVADIPNFNGHSVRVDHYSSTGTFDDRWIQEVKVKDGYVLIPDVTFSSIIVDGATGTYTSITYDADITDFEKALVGNYTDVSVSIPDAVDGVAMDENVSADYPAGAVAIYNFNGNSDDLLGINNGTDTNMTYGVDGAEFNGIDSAINMGNNVSLHCDDEITISVWVKTSSSGDYTIASHGYDAGGWELAKLGSRFLLYMPGSTFGEYLYSSNNAVPNGEWVHVAYTGKYGSYINCYINGV